MLAQGHWNEILTQLKHTLTHAEDRQSRINLSGAFSRQACVAAILHFNAENQLCLGVMQRALNPNDPWSGHLGLPGGGKDPSDSSDYAAVLREVNEEIGLALDHSSFLGRLDDLPAQRLGRSTDLYLTPFVFQLSEAPQVQLAASEVANFWWIPIENFLQSHRKIKISLSSKGQIVVASDAGDHFRFPAIDLGVGVPLWGLTLRILILFLEKILPALRNHNGSNSAGTKSAIASIEGLIYG